MNLYQKWRPKNLDEVVGHSKALKELKKRAKERNWPQVIYLTGKTGVGKSSLARIIAKTLTCTHLDEAGNPCNECAYCSDVDQESYILGVKVINASNVGIEEMRKIEEDTMTKSLNSKVQVFIIDELQELHANKKAQKNLLAVLEEVHTDVFFILGSMDDDKVDKAIKNRAQTFKLHDIGFEDVAKYLMRICKGEGITVDQPKMNVLMTIGESCDGSLRTAIAMLERCIYSEIWDEKDLIHEMGLVSNETLINSLGHLLQGDVRFLETEFNEEILKKVRFILSLTYKAQLGVELNKWQAGQVKSLPKMTDKGAVRQTINALNKLNTYIWLNQEIIDFHLLEAMEENKMHNEVPTRRRPIHG